MESTKEKVSYCIGLETGTALCNQYAEMDIDCLIQGIQDAASRSDAKLAKEEIQSILSSLRNQVEFQRRQNFSKAAEENKKRSEEFLSQNKTKAGVETLTSGLQYKILSSGSKAERSPTALDFVKIDYRGSFIDGRVFDSSYQRGQPLVTPLNRVMAGWAEVLQLMRVGDKWQVFVPHYLAYGEMGFQNVIGPNTALVFEIELLGINQQ